MAGYLDQYGAGEERRERLIKITVVSIVALIIAGGALYFIFRNYRQEQRVKAFFQLLEAKDYQSAYVLWGCTQQTPCRDYPLSAFMEDWGPQGRAGSVNQHDIVRSRSCGSGVIITVGLANHQEKLWVERDSLTIGFSPWPSCPPGR